METSFIVPATPSGMTILFWEETLGAPYHTTLVDYRQTGNPGYNLKIWGLADGANGWDTNDPHGPYLSGSAARIQRLPGVVGHLLPKSL